MPGKSSYFRKTCASMCFKVFAFEELNNLSLTKISKENKRREKSLKLNDPNSQLSMMYIKYENGFYSVV